MKVGSYLKAEGESGSIFKFKRAPHHRLSQQMISGKYNITISNKYKWKF